MASEARSLESLSGGGIQIRGRSERLESAESSGPEVFQGRPSSPDGDSPNRESENPARDRRRAFDTAKNAVETKKKPAIVHYTIAGQFVYPTVNRSSSRNLELREPDSNRRPRGYEPTSKTLQKPLKTIALGNLLTLLRSCNCCPLFPTIGSFSQIHISQKGNRNRRI